ncbi:MAG: urea ABC transporter permease subunit UrtB [Granulosicoccus sp.]
MFLRYTFFHLVLLCLLAASQFVHAEVTTGIAELDPVFEAFVEGKGNARTEALATLAALPRSDNRELLQGILDGDLMFHKPSGKIVWAVKDGREFTMTSLDRSEDLGRDSSRRIKRLKLTNSIRGYLRQLIAGLGLYSEDPVERLAAIDSLIDSPQSIEQATLDTLLENEKAEVVLVALRKLDTRKKLSSEDPLLRLTAVNALRGDLSSDSRRAIVNIQANDADEKVRAAALAVQLYHEQQVRLFGWLETLFFGLSLGSVLVLAAIGLAISFGVMGVINMAHGELIMLGAYCAWAMQQLMPQSIASALLLSIPVAFVFTGLVGIVIERTVIRFLYGRPLETLLATFGISLILQQLVRTFVSPQNVPVANPDFMSGVWQINGVFSLTFNRLYILVFCLMVFAALVVLLKRSRFGLEVRAVSQNRAMARAMGVRSSRIDSLTFGLGAGIAGIAGVALSQLTNVGPNLGQAYIVDSFMVVVFGGVGNLWGTLISGMTLGIANKLMEPWAGAILAKILVLVFLIIFIQKRPRGLFPQRGRAVEG